MKQIKFLLKLCALFLLLLSCNPSNELLDDNPELKVDNETINKIIEGFEQTLNFSKNQSEFDERVLGNHFIKSLIDNDLNINKNNTEFKNSNVTLWSNEFNDFLNKINDTSYQTQEEYLAHLQFLNEDVLSSRLSKEEKQVLINKIALMHTFVNWLETLEAESSKKSNLYAKLGCDGWWSCWGQCVAGTLGGAIVTGATLGFAGAAAGTFTVPIIGTVAGGTLGLVAGVVGGGLSGAAAAC